MPITMTKVAIIHIINCLRTRSSSNCSKLCAGSPMAPNTAISAAPVQVKIVPTREKRVNGSLRRRVAKAVLKTRPDWTL